MPSHFPSPGQQVDYKCPECGSRAIECTLAMYEFSTLVCQKCKYEELLDDWQIEEWFSGQDE